jgi:Ras-related protein Rab-6A
MGYSRTGKQNTRIYRLNVHIILTEKKKKERFRSLIPSYIRDSSVAVIVYDISSKEYIMYMYMYIVTN